MSYKKSKSIHVNRPEIDGNKSGRRRQNAAGLQSSWTMHHSIPAPESGGT